jgi:hypothetical protein
MLELAGAPGGEQLIVPLRSDDGRRAGVAILDASSLAIAHLLDLGPCGAPTALDGASAIDEHVQIRLGEEVRLLEPRAGREVLRLSERGATLFDDTGRPVWRGRL